MPAFNIAVYLSGTGSNFMAINENCKKGYLKSAIKLIISGNSEAGAISYANAENIPVVVLKRNDFSSSQDFAEAQLRILAEHEIDLIILAGYMKKISLPVIKKYCERILNIHPALLPAFGGKGMYGHFVHEAVIASKVNKSGATVHYADEVYDHGKILLQQEIDITPDDTPQSLQKKVLQVEYEVYSAAIKLLEDRQERE